MYRFKMSFNNASTLVVPVLSPNEKQLTVKNSIYMNMPLNAPMISRIHNAKPGCSACGKRVV